MNTPSAMQQRESVKPVKLFPAHDLVGLENKIHDMIAVRAHELFESRGCLPGKDVDDWIQAERQLIYSCRYEMDESREAIILKVMLPGSFTPEQLKISIEPRRLIVSGEKDVDFGRSHSEGTRTEKKPRRIFHVCDLPFEVDTSTTTATLKNELLEVVMPKLAIGVKPDKAKATSPGR
jgi:HSP20 family molecular chaperone IbpA